MSPNEIECSCVPINILTSDINDGRNPFGTDSEDCFQVDAKIIYNSDIFVNGTRGFKKLKILKNVCFRINRKFCFI